MSQEIKSEQEFKKLIIQEKLKKIFILSGENSFYKTGANQIIENILNHERYVIFLKKTKLPEFEELKKIIYKLQEYNPDIIIAIGGGCVMDLAKISSNLCESKNIKDDAIKSNLSKKKIKVIAIPTTAGSGAEVTANAVLYINNLKYSVEGEAIKPEFFYLIPELLSSSSYYLDATACFDAISQSVESLLSIKSNAQSIEFAKTGLKILLKNYKEFFKNKNITNSHEMLVGANFSGKAISISKTIAPHALSYPFTYIYGVPHGHAVSLTFNEILKFNFINLNRSKNIFDVKSRYQTLFELTKTNNINDLNNFFLQIKKDLKLEQNLNEMNINILQDKDKILSGINEQRLKNNPVKILSTDIKKILENMKS